MRRAVRGCWAALFAGLLAVAGFPGTASAHVTVAGDGTQGGYGRVAFRVPNESDRATTTKVEVFLPEGQPIASVSIMPVPGWSAAVQRKKLDKPVKAEGGEISEVVSSITWTAGTGTGIKDGEFQEFPVSLGPLPKADKLVFKALQTYSDGTVVRWIEEPGADGKEPESPAPTLTLGPAAATAGTSAPAAPTADGDRDGDGGSAEDEGGEAGLWLGIAGLIAGLGGLVLGGLAYSRTRRTP